MELLFHLSMIFTVVAVSLAGMRRSNSFFRNLGGPTAPVDSEFPEFQEGEDRFLVNPLNVDVLNFGSKAPQGSPAGFPWNPRSQLNSSPQQSPINICRSSCKAMKFRPLKIEYAKTSQKDGIVVEISNSGHGVTLKVPRIEARPSLIGGMLPNRYIFDNIHLHWGKDKMGSEHFLDGEAYAMECHMVTYNSKYKDLNDALNYKDDGVCVFTFFFQVTNEDNRKLQNLLDYIPNIRGNGTTINRANQEALLWVLEPVSRNKEYIAYPGSLTTSPYTEAVTFLILPEPVGVSRPQLALLRTLMDNHSPSKPVLSNRREIQSLNQRPVVCVKGTIQTAVREIPAEPNNDSQDRWGYSEEKYYWNHTGI